MVLAPDDLTYISTTNALLRWLIGFSLKPSSLTPPTKLALCLGIVDKASSLSRSTCTIATDLSDSIPDKPEAVLFQDHCVCKGAVDNHGGSHGSERLGGRPTTVPLHILDRWLFPHHHSNLTPRDDTKSKQNTLPSYRHSYRRKGASAMGQTSGQKEATRAREGGVRDRCMCVSTSLSACRT